MFKVDDYVIYGSTGVCKIIDIKKDEYVSSDDTIYYVLQPVYSNNMIIRVPTNNVIALMRPVLTKDDISSLIAMMPQNETIWIEDEYKRINDYKDALKTGNSEECIKIIQTLYLEKQAKLAAGRKLKQADENIMKMAEKQLYEEFAFVLNISPEEVVSYILEHIS